MNNQNTTLKTAVVTRVGKKETTDKNGKPYKYDSIKVGVIFDFDPDVWYNGFIYPSQEESLKEGKSLQVEVYDNVGTNGQTYKNFRIPGKNSVQQAQARENATKIDDHEARIKKLEDIVLGGSTKPSSAPSQDDSQPDLNPEDFDF